MVSVTNIRYVLVLIFKSVLLNSPFSSQLLIQRYFKLIVRQVDFTTHIYMCSSANHEFVAVHFDSLSLIIEDITTNLRGTANAK